jgi:lysophospholipase L1-like esterase
MKRVQRATVARGRGNARRVTTILLTVCVAGTFALTGGTALAKKPASKKHHPAAKQHHAGAKQHQGASGITPQTPITPGSTYLALGDSVTFGYEESSVVPAPNYSDASSFLGYPEQLGAALHLNVVNAACPGETSASLIDTSAQSNGCENTPGKGAVGYRTQFPLHVNYTGSQLAFAVNYLKTHHDVRLVSLMIGANDFFVCQETTADQCASLPEQAAVAASVATNVHTIVSAIRNQAHYNGQLAIVNYYSLDYSSATDNALSSTLNTTQDNAANPLRVEIADGFGELQAAAVHSGSNTCTAGLLTQLSTGGCGIHPSYAGQALLAQSLEKVIRLS